MLGIHRHATTKTLERVEPTALLDKDFAKFDQEFANAVEETLKYGHLKSELKKKSSHNVAAKELADALASVGIKPFKGESVARYKVAMAKKHNTRRKSAQWNSYTLAYHGREVPQFALQTALLVKQALPDAGFEIDELVIQKRNRMPQYDPFLVVTLYGVRAYLEVWDEPNFKGEREV